MEVSVTHGTFTIERVYGAAAERVFRAFADGGQKRRWFAEGDGRDVVAYEVHFAVGGRERTSTRFPEGTRFAGEILTNESVYLDIVDGRRIVFAYTMAFGERRFSASLATIELEECEGGTRMRFTEQGAYFEGSDGAQMREAGWRQILEYLGKFLS